MSYKVDFHTHSIASPDGALCLEQYRRMLQQGRLDFIAVTDHNTVDMAKELQSELGDRIIVGEEITTKEGEIIGLYLAKTVPPMLTALETVEEIHGQGGLVYIPHPFETARKGVPLDTLREIAKHVDIMEVHNGRALFQNYSALALEWAVEHGVAGAAASDAHGFAGWGRTYTLLEKAPTREKLVTLLQKAAYTHAFPGIHGMLYPAINRWRHRTKHA